jgi:hypothetical protein
MIGRASEELFDDLFQRFICAKISLDAARFGLPKLEDCELICNSTQSDSFRRDRMKSACNNTGANIRSSIVVMKKGISAPIAEHRQAQRKNS